MCSTAIIVIPTHFQKAMIIRNYFFMVRRMCVQPSLLARLATVSVLLFSWRGISCPSSYDLHKLFFMVKSTVMQPA